MAFKFKMQKTSLPSLLIFIICCICSSLNAGNCLIIGGGPAGLAASIEAYYAGLNPIIIEQRKEYLREQRVYLTTQSMVWLSEWGASIENLEKIFFDEYGEYGFVKIKDVEKGLKKVVDHLGIEMVFAEFTHLNKDLSISIRNESTEIKLPYDLLIAADGAKSLIRKNLNINCEILGQAKGSWMFVPCDCQNGLCDVTEIEKRKNYFLRKIKTPSASMIFTQSYFDQELEPFEFSLEDLLSEIEACQWNNEALSIKANKAYFSGLIPINLQKAERFVDIPAKTILIGDAAATGSFFHGMGINSAFKNVKIASDLFKSLNLETAVQDDKVMQDFRLNFDEDAFLLFNHQMQLAADDLLEFSTPLLNP